MEMVVTPEKVLKPVGAGLRAVQGQIGVIGFGTEMFYAFILIACSLMIYFGTRELYKLSGHRGIKYFRLSFLFFALAYFFRSFIKFLISSFQIKHILKLLPFSFGKITLFIFMYFSTLAILYLLYSVKWKEWDRTKYVKYFLHIISLLFAFLAIVYQNTALYIGINIVLFLLVLQTLYQKPKKKKKNHLFFIYVLLSLFWALNILDILIPTAFQYFQLLIYLASSFIFLLILYKVTKNIGST